MKTFTDNEESQDFPIDKTLTEERDAKRNDNVAKQSEARFGERAEAYGLVRSGLWPARRRWKVDALAGSSRFLFPEEARASSVSLYFGWVPIFCLKILPACHTSSRVGVVVNM